MATPNWLEHLRRELLATGISRQYRERLLRELSDHIEELHCDERNHAMSMEALSPDRLNARLGTPHDVAKAAQQHMPRSLFARRHPLLTFLLAPIPVLVTLVVIYALGLIGMLSIFKPYSDVSWAVATAGVLIDGLVYVPAVLLTLGIAWVAIRSETKIAWWIVAAGLVALFSCLMMVTFRMPTAPGTGMLQVGLGFPPRLAQLPQAAVPLAVTVACVVYSLRKAQRANPGAP